MEGSEVSIDERLFHSVFDSVEGAMWLLDTKHQLVIFNNRFNKLYFELTGQIAKHGSPITPLLKIADIEQPGELLEFVYQGVKEVYEVAVNSPTGKRYFRVSLNPLFEDEGISGISCYAIDITESKLAKEALLEKDAYLNSIFNTTNIAFALFDSGLKMLSYNHEVELFAQRELSREIKVGEYLADFFMEDRRVAMEMASKGVLAGMTLDVDADFKQSNGDVHWYNVKMHPVKDSNGGTLGIMLAIIDITRAKIAEQQRAKTTEKLVERNKRLEEFTYIVSHNMRAPVANIVGFANEVKDEQDTDIQKVYIHELTNAALKLDDVIRDLNDILQAKNIIEEAKSYVKFADMLDFAHNEVKNLLINEDITITGNFAEAEGMETIPSYMQNIFFNLLSNSIKYKNPNTKTHIEISSQQKQGSMLLRFKDNGLGIDLNQKGDQVFGLYKRFHLTIAGGKGMGLYITKTRVEALGGTIRVESEPNIGTEFFIEFAR